MLDSVLYKHDVENADRQDDGTAYRIFCSAFLEQTYNQEKLQNHSKDSLFIYLFIIGKYLLFGRASVEKGGIDFFLKIYFIGPLCRSQSCAQN